MTLMVKVPLTALYEATPVAPLLSESDAASLVTVNVPCRSPTATACPADAVMLDKITKPPPEASVVSVPTVVPLTVTVSAVLAVAPLILMIRVSVAALNVATPVAPLLSERSANSVAPASQPSWPGAPGEV